MSFKFVTGDLVRLVETPKEKLAAQLESVGGAQGVAEKLKVDLQQGLSSSNKEDLKLREDHFGRNYVAPPKAKSIFELMWDAFQDITIIVLTCAGALSIVLTMAFDKEHRDTGWIEGTVIIFAVLLVIVVTAMNDYQKEKQFRSLNAVKEDEKIKVIRDGAAAEVSKWHIVVGDIVRIELGDIVPADGIFIKGKELKMDESAMTGESDLLAKSEKYPVILSGTKVMEGFGQMLVVCVGENSQAGIIKTLINGKRQKENKNQSSVATTAGQTTAEGEVYVEMETPRSQSNRSQSQNDHNNAYDDGVESQSPLEGKLYKLTILIGQLGTITALIVFFAMSIRFSITKFVVDETGWESKYITEYLGFFIISITVLVVAIPEGLPLAVTISLAYSVKKMLNDNNLVRHLNACETMGSATTVCSDKTGTLTTNRMTVMKLWIGGREYSKAAEAQKDMSQETQIALFNGIAINSTAEILPPKVEGGHPEHTGSKTECALLQFGRDAGVEYTEIRQTHEISHMLTFSSAKKRMSVVTKLSNGKSRIYTKGATEVVLGLCATIQNLDGTIKPLENNERKEIGSDVIVKYAAQGYRTLCLAYRDVNSPAEELSEWSDEAIEQELTCIAIVGIEDPVRDEVPRAIELCASAGVTVRMVTGDNINTARSIANKCGIIKPGDGSLVMEGTEFRSRVLDRNGNIDQLEFNKIWPMLRVLARSSPKDKYTLVSGLMQTTLIPHGPQVVAVTGDGTNDAPALKKANVGFAMGISGTAVAKDASDIILMDDNFNSIVSAIKWGRNVYDSISKFLQFQLTVNIVAISLAVIGALVIEQSPLTAVQMLWVNLIMDTFASLALATEEPTDALLMRKPYPKTSPLVSKKMTKHLIGQSIYQLIVLGLLTFFGHKWFDIESGLVADIDDRGDSRRDPTVHMTIVFNTFVWAQLFNELNCRKIHDEMNIFKGILRNRVFLGICVIQAALQVVIVQFGGIYLNCAGLTITQWIICILLGAVSLPLGAILRSISVKNGPAWMAICREADVLEGKESSARGQELWIRGITRVRTQLRVVRAFQDGIASRSNLAIRES